MNSFLSEDEIIGQVTRLTRRQLYHFVESDLVKPRLQDKTYIFAHVDIARLELLCDLSQDLELNETSLAIVLSLIDQLHAARRNYMDLVQAIDALPENVKRQIGAGIKSD